MTVKTTVEEKGGLYFITITCQSWLPLFGITNGYDVVYQWFDHLKSKGHYINGYVILPNHIHLLAGFKPAVQSINTIISNGKRFMAYALVKKLQEQNEKETLLQLSEAVTPSDRKRGKRHQVFEPSFDIKECIKDKFIQQKLDYMHDNPIKGKWNLAPCAADYVHSSAKFYSSGEQGLYEVMNYKELDDINLNA